MTKPVSALRQRMIDDMKARNMAWRPRIYVRGAELQCFHAVPRQITEHV